MNCGPTGVAEKLAYNNGCLLASTNLDRTFAVLSLNIHTALIRILHSQNAPYRMVDYFLVDGEENQTHPHRE